MMTNFDGAAMSAPGLGTEPLAPGDDSAAILQDTAGRLARPLLIALATSAAAVLLALGFGRVVRMVRHAGQPAV